MALTMLLQINCTVSLVHRYSLFDYTQYASILYNARIKTLADSIVRNPHAYPLAGQRCPNITTADSVAPDQTAHPMISQIHPVLHILDGAANIQTARMYRLIWILST